MFRTELMKQWLGYDDQKSMENFFESVALERNIPIVGLDNIGETMYMLFDREPFHWQCKELLKVIEYPENEVKQERAIRDMYRDGRLTDLAYQVEGPNNTTSISFSDYKEPTMGQAAPTLPGGRRGIHHPQCCVFRRRKGLAATTPCRRIPCPAGQ